MSSECCWGWATRPANRSRSDRALWLGEYIVAWPQIRTGPWKSGEASPALPGHCREDARAVDPPWTGGDVFDAGFESWLIAFQRQHGLTADGIIGPRPCFT